MARPPGCSGHPEQRKGGDALHDRGAHHGMISLHERADASPDFEEPLGRGSVLAVALGRTGAAE
jgi:hypothetical protein